MGRPAGGAAVSAVTGRLALDLFCGCGGAAEGLQRAGFTVIGVDTDPRCGRYYPGLFVLGDALRPPFDLGAFDLVWASPPCQRWSPATLYQRRREHHPDLVEPTRALLAGHPATVIENVPHAPVRADMAVTGPQVGLDRIIRLRHFELSWFALQAPPAPRDPDLFASGRGVTITKSMCSVSHYYHRKRLGLSGRVPVAEAREAMGITVPMPAWGVGEAVPPAYAELVARSLPEALR